MSNPLVSCICPTYGRVPYDIAMFEECVYWFTRQEYANKELLICNDATNQELVCEVPGVRIINLCERFPTLGRKYNFMVSQAAGDIVLPWEDDDISLPQRIPQSVKHLKGMYQYWNPRGSWFQNGPAAGLIPCIPGNVFHNTSAYQRYLWLKGCRYDPNATGNQDTLFDMQAARVAKCNPLKLPTPAEYVYVYRWQHGSGDQPNLSGHPDTQGAYNKRPDPIPGTYLIEPRMHRDYVAEVVALCKRDEQ